MYYSEMKFITYKVLGATFDGASVNRRFLKLHIPSDDDDDDDDNDDDDDTVVNDSDDDDDKIIYKVRNCYACDHRYLFFFSDPPHLMKTTRNCWFSKYRTLWVYA